MECKVEWHQTQKERNKGGVGHGPWCTSTSPLFKKHLQSFDMTRMHAFNHPSIHPPIRTHTHTYISIASAENRLNYLTVDLLTEDSMYQLRHTCEYIHICMHASTTWEYENERKSSLSLLLARPKMLEILHTLSQTCRSLSSLSTSTGMQAFVTHMA